MVARLCERIGVPHHIMRWSGPHPTVGIPAAARLARYRLIHALAGDLDAGVVALGHTADDQAETVAMRRVRGEGPGLAGMADATLVLRSLWAVRPLLGLTRASLRRFLAASGVTWVDDPSNADPTFERVRIRDGLDDATRTELCRAARDRAEARTAVSLRAAGLVRDLVRHEATGAWSGAWSGVWSIDRALLDDDPGAARVALAALAAVIGGANAIPSAAQADGLLQGLRPTSGRVGLSGAIFDCRGREIAACREWRGTGPAAATVAPDALWDGRFVNAGRSPVPVRATGFRERDAGRRSIEAIAAAALPFAEAAGSARIEPGTACWHAFLPAFDLALAAAVRALSGCAPLPPAPVRSPLPRHIRGYA